MLLLLHAGQVATDIGAGAGSGVTAAHGTCAGGVVVGAAFPTHHHLVRQLAIESRLLCRDLSAGGGTAPRPAVSH